MNILSQWIRSYVPALSLPDRELAEALTLRGIAVEGIFELGPENGSLFEMDITTNRVDAMNHYGVAREVAAIGGLVLPPLEAALPAPRPAAGSIAISIEEPRLCGRFTARRLSDVRIRPSEGLVADRFRLLQQKPISNAVDATNYVLLAMGHPTHAFDRDKLEGGIIVRRARGGEKLKTLDGVERVLDAEDLVIADEKKVLGLAGVIGGWDTMITAETRNILVEAAWFDPAAVRRSSKRHGLHTDASHRFERGADFNGPPIASALVSQLILQSGGYVEGDLIDVATREAEARTAGRVAIALSHREVRRILGATEDGRGVEQDTTESVLQALGCGLKRVDEGEYRVTLPSWRLDLEREIDLIEEVARVYGYNRFANTLPVFSGIVQELPEARKEAVVRQTLLGLGWNEALSSTFCSATDAATFAPLPGIAVAMGNPLNEEAGLLRPSLVPGMLTMLAHNLNRNVADVQLFERGTVFSGSPERVDERPALSLGASGSLWSGPGEPAHAIDFYDLKGTIEEILEKFALHSFYFDTFASGEGIIPAWLHPGRAARAVADGLTVAWFGQLHPAEAQQRKFRQDVYAGEIYLDRLYQLSLRQPIAPELSRFQAVERDFSFVFADAVRWQSIRDALENLSIAELTDFAPREIFRGTAALPSSHYSILIRVTFQALERTLREEDLQSYSQAVVAALESLGGRQRA
ncbi:MAG: phenylalanine--tRNA ligase subunit beta [Acidobacteriaceae bacterium]